MCVLTIEKFNFNKNSEDAQDYGPIIGEVLKIVKERSKDLTFKLIRGHPKKKLF